MAPSMKDRTHGYTVTYESERHFALMTQMWGSIWPKVLPYCITNMLLAILLDYLKFYKNIDLEISVTAYKSLSLLVAFLVVSRANVTIGRYNQARGFLTAMFKPADDLIELSCIFSGLNNKDKAGAEWRYNVARRTFLLLRSAMCVMDYNEAKVPAWKLKEFTPEEAADIQRQIYLDITDNGVESKNLAFAHSHHRHELEENMRVPILCAFSLRRAIHSQGRLLKKEISLAEENKLLGCVDGIMGGYYGMRKHLTTPFPFPLVQMARTFLFLYVYTVPFALLSDASYPIAHYIIVFFLTFGFMGIEYVSMELDDPFGEDVNDFKNRRIMYVAFEDVYTTLRDVDGDATADRLRLAMHVDGEELNDEQQWLLQARK